MRQPLRFLAGAVLVALLASCAGPTSPVPATPWPTLPTVTAVPTSAPTPAPTLRPLPTAYPLSGLPAGDSLHWPPLALIIPTDSEQYGLSQASLVYEAVTEGGIPRFLAIFEDLEAQRVGPIRSARPYHLNWACPYGPLFVYWGGSPQALSLLGGSECLRPLDGQVYGRAYFFAVEDPQVPWNSQFSSGEQLYSYLQNWDITPWVDYQGYSHKEDAPLALLPLTATVSFAFSYPVHYEYDRQENAYRRYVGGRPHLDLLTGEALLVKNVVLIFVPQEVIADDEAGRMAFQTSGQGEALVLMDGLQIPGFWVKETPQAELRLLDADGAEIALNRGNTWIAVLAPGQRFMVQGGGTR